MSQLSTFGVCAIVPGVGTRSWHRRFFEQAGGESVGRHFPASHIFQFIASEMFSVKWNFPWKKPSPPAPLEIELNWMLSKLSFSIELAEKTKAKKPLLRRPDRVSFCKQSMRAGKATQKLARNNKSFKLMTNFHSMKLSSSHQLSVLCNISLPPLSCQQTHKLEWIKFSREDFYSFASHSRLSSAWIFRSQPGSN